MSECSRVSPCPACLAQPATDRPAAITPPGPVGMWLLDGWWQHSVAYWPMRGLQYELGTRTVAAMRRRQG